VTPSSDGCALFVANSSPDTVEYLVVAQSVATLPNRQAQFRLAGEASVLGPATSVVAALDAQAATPSPAEQFHTFLREEEARAAKAPRPPGALAAIKTAPPQAGDQRAFKVCSNLTCAPPMRDVTGVVVAVGQHLALYVDVQSVNSLAQADYDEMVAAFDQRLYPLDTLAFGVESDVDGNGVVMVLMTPAINRLVTAQTCQTSGYIAGYFFGLDIDPSTASSQNYNHGELFYTIVPDPSGEFSCSHDGQRVKDIVPVVFVHELQHMISYNYHVLLPGRTVASTEVLWLNEALSHYAEEIGGRTYLPGDNPTFSKYLSGNIRNAYDYMSHTGDHFVISQFGNGTLGERGAGWLLIRYIIDQLATDSGLAAWHPITRRFEQSSQIGVANVEEQTGVPMDQTLARWALSLWVSDLPGFTTPPELKIESWHFRTTYAGLYPGSFSRPYPLEPPVAKGTDVDIAGTLRSGSGVYERVRQPPNSASFTLQLAQPDGGPVHPSLAARLTVIRVK
jgi:hypothetical protein